MYIKMIDFLVHKLVKLSVHLTFTTMCMFMLLGHFKKYIYYRIKKSLYVPTQLSQTYDLNSIQLFYVEELRREGVWIVLEFKLAGCLYTTPYLPFSACSAFIKKYKWRLPIGQIACMSYQMLQLEHLLIRSNNQP